jgi:peptidyl-prolyl cis-trans isomerase A (cyclophilin A)
MKGKPYFDGQVCHRVIAGFMMQCGDPTASGAGGPGYQFGNEFVNDLKMDPGTLAMANADDPSVGRVGTNGSQFFVMEGARPDLVGHHTIFGKCAELDVVKKITHTPTTADKPNTPVTINKVTISKG